ncbi:hypothetical protein B0H13DRAFT_133335 [Mycena leptocephala]|nr:hypothetical protein B0H13DRAFT_133335 [Mycena leptocephala]
MDIYAFSWDHSVYTGIRQFHQAKGFDPCGQEVALALGCPLLRVSCQQDTLFEHSTPGISVDLIFSDGFKAQDNDPGDIYSDSDNVSDSQDVSTLADEKSELDDSVNKDPLPVQEADIDAAHRPSSSQDSVSEHKEVLLISDVLDDPDEQYVLNTSMVWGASSVGDQPSWNDKPWR